MYETLAVKPNMKFDGEKQVWVASIRDVEAEGANEDNARYNLAHKMGVDLPQMHGAERDLYLLITSWTMDFEAIKAVEDAQRVMEATASLISTLNPDLRIRWYNPPEDRPFPMHTLDNAPGSFIAGDDDVWKPETWEKQGYKRNFGDAAVMSPYFEVLRKEETVDKYLQIRYVILCPTFLRRPLEIYSSQLENRPFSSWASY